MFPESSLLHALVPEQLRHREPAHRLAQRLRARSHHPGERRRHLGAQGNGTTTLVDKIEELTDDLVAALLRVQLEWFERRPIVLQKRIAPHDAAPGLEDMGSLGELFGIEIPETREDRLRHPRKLPGERIDLQPLHGIPNGMK